MVGDSAVGLSTLSQTNTVAVYDPESLGVHDNAGLIDCPAVKDPVIHANAVSYTHLTLPTNREV